MLLLVITEVVSKPQRFKQGGHMYVLKYLAEVKISKTLRVILHSGMGERDHVLLERKSNRKHSVCSRNLINQFNDLLNYALSLKLIFCFLGD